MSSAVKIMRTSDFDRSLSLLMNRGGNYQRAAEQVFSALGRAQFGDPFEGLKLTKSGENRIEKCVKYDLNKFCRLIVVSHSKHVFLCFVGTHKSCDQWLDNNRGSRIQVDGSFRPLGTFESFDITRVEKRLQGKPASFLESLLGALPRTAIKELLADLDDEMCSKLKHISSLTPDDEILAILESVRFEKQKTAIFDALMLLRAGKLEEAERGVSSFTGNLTPIENLKNQNLELKDSQDWRALMDSDQYRKLIEHFSKTASFQDWMLFMHPDQEELVSEDFDKPCKLVGVSGSGKTCVVVKRAVRLAEENKDSKILVLTLNRSLAALIDNLAKVAGSSATAKRIEVLPLFTLCQRLLGRFEPNNNKLYDDKAWKSLEHIDEVWREYYRCELNNHDASVMQPVHDSLISRGIDAESYIREEFDWIRSAIPPTKREAYLEMKRFGRSFPMPPQFRIPLLKGLEYWERKMRDVGVTDYLGLTTALDRYKQDLWPQYTSILIDESQDFGTVELDIVRRLVSSQKNDLFLCGDAAQQVSSKHQDFSAAGISIPSSNSRKLTRNYRNSREILDAAYDVLYRNLTEEIIDVRDFEVLDPQRGYFHGPAPLLLQGDSLEWEIAAALKYLQNESEASKLGKACLSICGHSLHEIERFGERLGLPVLDGTRGLENGDVFLSDLENTKGFEFQFVCIVNCAQGIIPYPGAPEVEQFRDLTRLYVAMTRARHQLIISFSNCKSPYLEGSEYFLEDTWEEYLGPDIEELTLNGIPEPLESFRTQEDPVSFGEMTGEQFLYTQNSIGLDALLVEKLRSQISGNRRKVSGKPVEWKNFATAAKDIRIHPASRNAFGPKGFDLFKELLEQLGLE